MCYKDEKHQLPVKVARNVLSEGTYIQHKIVTCNIEK